MTRPEIVKRLRGAAEFAREFGSPQGADIYEVAADEIEQSVRVSEVLDLIARAETKLDNFLDGALISRAELESEINQLAGKAET